MTAPPRFAPRALLLDMDGLLIDSEPLWFRVEQAFARSRGGIFTDAHAAECVGRGIRSTLTYMGELFGFAIDEARDEKEIVDGFVARVAELELKPGCRELLFAARGNVRLVLASSSPTRLIRAALDRFALAPLFDAIVSGETVPRPKPAPDIFLRACADVGVSPCDAVVLEDSLAGATAGRAAGASVIAVPEGAWEGRGFEEVADLVARDLYEARAALELGRR